MRRLAALVLLCAAPAWGQAPPMVPAPLPAPPPANIDGALAVMRARGRPEILLSDFGAVPGGGNGFAVRAAIRAANAAFKLPAAQLPDGSKTLRIPPGSWTYDRPTPWDAPFVAIKGEGSSLVAAGGLAAPALMVGIGAAPLGKALTPDHGSDAFGRLDTSAAPRPAFRWSWRNRDDTHLAGWASPWNLGPPKGWSSARALTVEFALDATGIPIGRAMIAGMSAGQEARPWLVYGRPGVVGLRLRLKGVPKPVELAIPYRATAKVERFGFQLDFANGVALGWHDNTIVAPTGDTLPAGSSLADNENEPFHVGGAGRVASNWFGEYFQANPTPDADHLGLRVGNALRYAPGPAGSPLARIDGGPVNDAYGYFDAGPSCVAYLPLRDDPATLTEDRLVAWASGLSSSLRGYLFAVDKACSGNLGGNNTSVAGVSTSGVRYQGASPVYSPYGEGLTLGAAINFRADNCGFIGGAHGIGTPNWLANYYHRLTGCTLAGADAALYLFQGQAIVRDCESPVLGRRTVWSVNSRLTVEHWPLPNASIAAKTPECLLYAWGGDVSANDLSADIESGDMPSVALFWGVATSWERTPSGCYLELRRCGAGAPLRTVPIVRLDTAPVLKAGQARIVDCWTYNPSLATVLTAGGWDVAIDNLVRPPYPAVLDLSAPGPPAPGQPVGTVSVAR